MTVPVGVASDQSPANQGILMPKLKYRFRVIFQNFGVSTPTTELTKQVTDFRRPSASFEDILIPIYNSTIKLAGKASWAEVTCNLRDDAQGNVQKLVGEQVQKQMDFLEMASASSGIDYKFTTVFQILDGGNGSAVVPLETWELYGCYIKQVDYGEVNYGSSEPVTVGLTIQFDNAAQLPAGVGTSIISRPASPSNIATGLGSIAAAIATVA
jgi:hypothetical protein